MKILLALMLLATPAFATTRAATDQASLMTAAAASGPGDIITLADATYDSLPMRTIAAGTAGAYIRVVGNLASPSSVNFTRAGYGIWIKKAYQSVAGIKVNGGILIEGTRDSVAYVIADSGAVRVSPLSGKAFNNAINNTTLHVGVLGDQFAWMMAGNEDASFYKVRVLGAQGTSVGNNRGRYMYYCKRDTFTDCHLDIDFWAESTDPNGEQRGLGIRDSSRDDVFLRDTLWVNQTSHGDNLSWLSMPGEAGQDASTANNNWYYCDYRAWGGYGFQAHAGFRGGGIWFSTFVSHGDAALWLTDQVLDFTLRGNTILDVRGFGLLQAADFTGTTIIRGNAFVTRSYPAVLTGSYDVVSGAAAGLSWTASGAVVDSNFYSAPISRMAIYTGPYDGSYGCYTLSDWVYYCGGTNNDAHSKFAIFSGDMFKNANASKFVNGWPVLDLRPARNSSLKDPTHTYTTNGYFGALAPAN